MRKLSLAAVGALALLAAGCSTAQVEKIQTATDNFNKSVAAINGSIAAVSPTVARGCADIQKYAMLLRPLAAQAKGKSLQYFDAANGAITAYCQNVPTDIQSTAVAVAAAVNAAADGYNQVR